MDKIASGKIKKLIEKYNKVLVDNQLRGYNEEMTKQHFILPLFNVLGWNTENADEVRAEDHVKLAGRVDDSFIR